MKSFWKQVKLQLLVHFREPEVILWGFIFPALMILVLGFVFSKKAETQSVGVTDASKAHPAYEEFMAGLTAVEMMHVVEGSLDDLAKKATAGEVDLIVGLAIEDDAPSLLNSYVASDDDPKNEIRRLRIEQIIASLDRGRVGLKDVDESMLWTVEHRVLESSDDTRVNASYVARLIPGVMMYNLFMGCIFGIGIVVVRDKQRGKFKKLATTPLSKTQFILTTSLGRMLLMVFQVSAMIVVGYLFFKVPVVGSWIELAFAIFLSVWMFLIFGFAIAAVSKSIEKAVALSNVFFVFSTILSGAFFSTAQMPVFVQSLSYLLPPTSAIELVRGVYTYGDSVFAHPLPLGVLIGWFVLSLYLARARFKWHED